MAAPPRGKYSILIPLAVVLLLLIVIVWPSPYSKVRNLDSRGANLIAFGDSLTAGYGANPGEDYPTRLSALIGEPVINAGVSGDTTGSALAITSKRGRMVPLIRRFAPDGGRALSPRAGRGWPDAG